MEAIFHRVSEMTYCVKCISQDYQLTGICSHSLANSVREEKPIKGLVC